MTGLLIFNQDRPDIVLETGILYGGLHCGDCFCCLIDSEWIDVRLEYIAILPRPIATLTALCIMIAHLVRKSKKMINSHDF